MSTCWARHAMINALYLPFCVRIHRDRTNQGQRPQEAVSQLVMPTYTMIGDTNSAVHDTW